MTIEYHHYIRYSAINRSELFHCPHGKWKESIFQPLKRSIYLWLSLPHILRMLKSRREIFDRASVPGEILYLFTFKEIESCVSHFYSMYRILLSFLFARFVVMFFASRGVGGNQSIMSFKTITRFRNRVKLTLLRKFNAPVPIARKKLPV